MKRDAAHGLGGSVDDAVHEAQEADRDVKLWLDDVRPEPEGWLRAKTADEAVAILKTGRVDTCSLDHDLADEHYHGDGGWMPVHREYKEKTGYDVVLWMAENNVWPRIVLVHSMNPVGKERMRGVVERYKPK